MNNLGTIIPYFVSPQEAIMKILLDGGFEHGEILCDKTGTFCVVTEREVPENIRLMVDQVRPIGILMIYKVAVPSHRICFCFGPPAKDCPLHGYVI